MAQLILVIDPDIAFTLPLKRGLENLGDFEIRTVTRLRPAVLALENALNSNPYSIAVVDTALDYNTPSEVIDALRTVQPNLPIILTSRRTDHADFRTALKTQAFLRKPYPATILASLIRTVVAQGFSFSHAETRLHIPEGEIDETLDPSLDDIVEPLLEASQEIVPYLAEPPVDAGNDTIRDVIEAALEPEVSRQIHDFTEGADELRKQPPPPPKTEPPMPPAAPVTQILFDASNEESLDNMIQGIRYKSFPQFESPPIDLNDTSKMIIEALPAPKEATPSTIPKPEHLPDQYWIDSHGKDVPDFSDTQFVQTTVEEFTSQLRAFEAGIESAATPPPAAIPDDIVAHYALQLTQFSLESSAAGAVVTKGKEVLARSGNFDMETWDYLVLAVQDAWKRKGDARTRIIYRRLINTELLLYSIKTIDNQILTLIFSSDMPLKAIGRQAEKLAESLRAVPPPPPPDLPSATLLDSPPAPPPVIRPIGTYVGYACVWLLEDSGVPISQAGGQAIERGLRSLCAEQDWDFQKLDVQADWLAFHLDVPTSILPNTLMTTLMQTSEENLLGAEPQRHPNRLWSDGYLITTPPQDLTDKDIQRFIRFYRREKVGNGR